MIVVNARFLTQDITGVQRFAIEISKQLKRLYGENIQFVCPKNIVNTSLEKELEAKAIGNLTGHLWEQVDLPLYLKKKATHCFSTFVILHHCFILIKS